jgi:hypothetical protein
VGGPFICRLNRAELEAGKVDDVTIDRTRIKGTLTDHRPFQSWVPHAQLIPALTDRMLAKEIVVRGRPAGD